MQKSYVSDRVPEIFCALTIPAKHSRKTCVLLTNQGYSPSKICLEWFVPTVKRRPLKERKAK